MADTDEIQESRAAEDELPEGWAWTTLGQICTAPQYGYTTKAISEGNGPKFLRITDLTSGHVDWDTVPFCYEAPDNIEKYELHDGDIVIARAGSVGKAFRVVNPPEAVFASYLIRFRPIEVSERYIEYFLQSPKYWRQIQEASSGITLLNVNAQKMQAIFIPLAPLPEQQRIVEAIESLFTQLDAGVAALKRLRANLKRYKAAVLKAACEGRLVPQDPNDEPASALLHRILAERRTKWETEQRVKGKDPRKLKYEEPAAPDTSDLPELPEGWTWARIKDVGDVRLGRQRAPQHHTGPHMRPYLRVANVFEDYIDTSDVLEMNFTPREYEIYRLQYGDILLNEGQSLELVGRSAIYRDEVPGACFQNTLVRFQVSSILLREYAQYVFRAYLHSGRFQKIAKWTTTMAHLGAQRFADLEFPLPPLPEQERIIAEVEAIMSEVRVLESTINANLKRAERLRQAILKQAFEGKLVAQDPNDEPATMLLERVRAGRKAKPKI